MISKRLMQTAVFNSFSHPRTFIDMLTDTGDGPVVSFVPDMGNDASADVNVNVLAVVMTVLEFLVMPASCDESVLFS